MYKESITTLSFYVSKKNLKIQKAKPDSTEEKQTDLQLVRDFKTSHTTRKTSGHNTYTGLPIFLTPK